MLKYQYIIYIAEEEEYLELQLKCDSCRISLEMEILGSCMLIAVYSLNSISQKLHQSIAIVYVYTEKIN